MPAFKVICIHRDTGDEQPSLVFAGNEDLAREVATARGFIVGPVSKATIAESGQLPALNSVFKMPMSGKRSRPRDLLLLLLVGVGICVPLALGTAWLQGDLDDIDTSGILSGGGARGSDPKRVKIPGVGEVGRLHTQAGDTVYAGITPTAFDALSKAVNAKDDFGLMELLGSGQIVALPAGTKVRVLETSFSKSEARVLEGDAMGLAIWVAPGSIRE